MDDATVTSFSVIVCWSSRNIAGASSRMSVIFSEPGIIVLMIGASMLMPSTSAPILCAAVIVSPVVWESSAVRHHQYDFSMFRPCRKYPKSPSKGLCQGYSSMSFHAERVLLALHNVYLLLYERAAIKSKTRWWGSAGFENMAERKRFELLVPFEHTRFPIVLLRPTRKPLREEDSHTPACRAWQAKNTDFKNFNTYCDQEVACPPYALPLLCKKLCSMALPIYAARFIKSAGNECPYETEYALSYRATSSQG